MPFKPKKKQKKEKIDKSVPRSVKMAINKSSSSPLLLRKQMRQLRKMITGDEVLSEKSSIELTRAMLGALLESVKIAEKQYRAKPTSNNGFALNVLSKQALEYAKELRLMQTQEHRLVEVTDEALNNGLRRLLFQFSQAFISSKATVEKNCPSKKAAAKINKYIDRVSDNVGMAAQEVANMIREEIVKNA